MAHYLIQGSFTPETVANLVKNPEDRAAAIRRLAQSIGGRLEAYYFTFGDYDVAAIVELPDNVTMAALSMVGSAGGGFKAVKTTVLIPMNEAVEAMRKAGTIGYRPPGG